MEQIPNFTSNVGANLATGALFLLVWFIKNKCKHSRCDTKSGCCSCHIDDYEENTDTEIENSKENDDKIPRKVNGGLQIV